MKPFYDISRSRFRAVALLVLSATVAQSLDPDLAMALMKRSSRKSQPVSPKHAAPDVTSTIPASKEAAPRPVPAIAVPQESEGAVPPPFYLPNAPRARMRHCGEEWQTIKMAGRAADETWREFATKCLVQADEPKKGAP